MKRILLIIVLVGLTFVLWLYMIVSASKYKVLVDDVANLQKTNLTSLT